FIWTSPFAIQIEFRNPNLGTLMPARLTPPATVGSPFLVRREGRFEAALVVPSALRATASAYFHVRRTHKETAMGFYIGNKVINTTQRISGFHIGNIAIAPASTLTVDGFIIGNIHVDLNAKLIVNGFVIGNITGHIEFADINGFLIGNKRSKQKNLRKISIPIREENKIR
ncbi:bactofilin family protein, partial [Uliginosibacterium aquaticum]